MTGHAHCWKCRPGRLPPSCEPSESQAGPSSPPMPLRGPGSTLLSQDALVPREPWQQGGFLGPGLLSCPQQGEGPAAPAQPGLVIPKMKSLSPTPEAAVRHPLRAVGRSSYRMKPRNRPPAAECWGSRPRECGAQRQPCRGRVSPVGHSHRNSLILSRQWPFWRQGLLAHSSVLISQCTPS